MRALFLSRSLPRPERGGADLRASQIVDALGRLGSVAVFGLHHEFPTAPPRPEIAIWCSSSVEGLTEGAASRQVLDWLRTPTGHPCDLWFSPVAAEDARQTAVAFQPDVIVIDHLWLYRYIQPLSGLGSRIVLNTHNVEGSLQRELAGRQHGGAGMLSARLGDRTDLIEDAAVRMVDQVWACSETDRAAFLTTYPGCAPVAVVPNAIDVETYPAPRPPRELVVIFPGVFNYPPNAVAAGFLIDDVLPLLPGATLTLAGREPTAAMTAAAALEPRIVVTGPVPDMRPCLAAASVMAVPLFEGGGTRFKVLEAFAAQLPVVSTRKGVAGLEVEDGAHVLFAETPEEFARAIERLDSDVRLRTELVARALALVRERYSWDSAALSVAAALDSQSDLRI